MTNALTTLLELDPQSDWRSRASCSGLDPAIFFPVGTTTVASRQLKLARRTCRQCPVASPCLDWALRTAQGPGIWGGRTEAERVAMEYDETFS